MTKVVGVSDFVGYWLDDQSVNSNVKCVYYRVRRSALMHRTLRFGDRLRRGALGYARIQSLAGLHSQLNISLKIVAIIFDIIAGHITPPRCICIHSFDFLCFVLQSHRGHFHGQLDLAIYPL